MVLPGGCCLSQLRWLQEQLLMLSAPEVTQLTSEDVEGLLRAISDTPAVSAAALQSEQTVLEQAVASGELRPLLQGTAWLFCVQDEEERAAAAAVAALAAAAAAAAVVGVTAAAEVTAAAPLNQAAASVCERGRITTGESGLSVAAAVERCHRHRSCLAAFALLTNAAAEPHVVWTIDAVFAAADSSSSSRGRGGGGGFGCCSSVVPAALMFRERLAAELNSLARELSESTAAVVVEGEASGSERAAAAGLATAAGTEAAAGATRMACLTVIAEQLLLDDTGLPMPLTAAATAAGDGQSAASTAAVAATATKEIATRLSNVLAPADVCVLALALLDVRGPAAAAGAVEQRIRTALGTWLVQALPGSLPAADWSLQLPPACYSRLAGGRTAAGRAFRAALQAPLVTEMHDASTARERLRLRNLVLSPL